MRGSHSGRAWSNGCTPSHIIYDKFHILQHASKAVDEVRRAEFFRKGGAARDIVRGKRWLLLSSWVNLDRSKKRQLNQLFALNRRVMKAYLLKESLAGLWGFIYEGAMLRYLQSWIAQLRWQRLAPMPKLAHMLLNHLEGILNYCRTKIPLAVVEAVNGNDRLFDYAAVALFPSQGRHKPTLRPNMIEPFPTFALWLPASRAAVAWMGAHGGPSRIRTWDQRIMSHTTQPLEP